MAGKELSVRHQRSAMARQAVNMNLDQAMIIMAIALLMRRHVRFLEEVVRRLLRLALGEEGKVVEDVVSLDAAGLEAVVLVAEVVLHLVKARRGERRGPALLPLGLLEPLRARGKQEGHSQLDWRRSYMLM